MKGRVSDWSLAWLLQAPTGLSLQCNTAAASWCLQLHQHPLQHLSIILSTDMFMSFDCPLITSELFNSLLDLQFLNISEVNVEIREVRVEGVIFSFPTQKKLDRLEIKFNDIEPGNITAPQPHHHKDRNNLESVAKRQKVYSSVRKHLDIS